MKYKDCRKCVFYKNKEKSECAGDEERLYNRDHCPEFSTEKPMPWAYSSVAEERERWDF